MQRQLHALSAAVALHSPLWTRQRWGLLSFLPGRTQPFRPSPATHCLFRVVSGALVLLFGNGIDLPHELAVGAGDVLFVRPHNFSWPVQ
jgi:hypothetical protein